MPSAELAVDAAAGSVLLGGAAEVLVPFSLVSFMESSTGQERCRAMAEQWRALVQDELLVVLVDSDEVDGLLSTHPAYTKLCVPVPGGPLVAKKLFCRSEDSFYDEVIPRLTRSVEAARNGGRGKTEWRAWMRSALTCMYEGVHVAPIRVSERVASLLSGEGGCSRVVLEAGVSGLRPRWLETVAKTALSCGVPMASLSLALCDSPNVAGLLAKAVEAGITRFATTTLRSPCLAEEPTGGGLFTGTAPLMCIDTAVAFAVGWNECGDRGGQLTKVEEALLKTSGEYKAALADEWASLLLEER